MKKFFLTSLQTALNRYLALDPESKQRLLALQGKIATIELLDMGLTLQMIFTDSRIEIKSDEFSKPDTIIKGTPLSLLRMALTEGDRKHFFANDVSIEGNLDLGQHIIDLFDELEIDWEEYVSGWMGDVPAHQLGRMARGVKKFVNHVQETLLQNTNEYVHEEVDLFPACEAVQDFFKDVDALRMDVDRVEARIERLTREAQ